MLFFIFTVFSLIIALNSHVIKRDDRIVYPNEDEDGDESRFEVLEFRFNDGSKIESNPDANLNAEFKAELFQGDIKLTEEQESFFSSPKEDGEEDEEGVLFKTGLIDRKYRWKKNSDGKAIVPYVINSEADFSNDEKRMIVLGMRDLQKYTCAKFKQRTNEKDYVEIISDGGCYSYLGRTGNRQYLSLQKNECFSIGTVIHEFIHALGYDHMHNHVNRDEHIDIKWENVHESSLRNFQRVDPTKFHNFGTPYDYMSVMHYPSEAGSSNGEPTIVAKKAAFRDKIGQRRGLSRGDIARINAMYECSV